MRWSCAAPFHHSDRCWFLFHHSRKTLFHFLLWGFEFEALGEPGEPSRNTPTSWSDLILQLNTDSSSPPRCSGLFGRGTTVPFDNVCVSQLHLRRLWATQSLKWLLPAEERLRSKVSTYFWVILAASVRGIKEYGTVTTENIIMLPLRAKNTEMKRQCRGNRGFTLQVTETQCTIIITEDK